MGEKVAWIGLGVMGYPMAGFLQKAGHDVTVYNRTSAKAEKWTAEYGGSSAATPREAAEGQERSAPRRLPCEYDQPCNVFVDPPAGR